MKKDFWAIFLIVIFTGLFFLRLFYSQKSSAYPTPSFFVTPDFGGSDMWQLNLPAKFFLSQSLKNNQLPVWNQNIGLGFPMTAEGQIGAFNLTNLIFFKFLPFIYAFNLGFVFIFAFTGIGAYLYLRNIKINRLVSLFSALSFSYSAFFACHISHFNLIQTASFLPWLFLFTERIINDKSQKSNYLLFSFFLAQQIFSGFPQITFITLIGITGYLILRLFSEPNRRRFSVFLFFSFSVFLGFSLSAIQLLPQVEFLINSTRAAGQSLSSALQYSFSLHNLLMFVNPNALGTPANGTYPDLIASNFAVFWENNGFMGFLPIAGVFLAIFFLRRRLTIIYFLILGVSFLLMLGRYSPLYVVYLFPPFSFFRVPSRFILPFIWSIIVISSLALNVIICKIAPIGHTAVSQVGKFLRLKEFLIGLIGVGLMIASLFHLLSFSYNYNPIAPAQKILEPPETANFLKNLSTEKQNRFFLIPDHEFWNQVFLKRGWQDFSPFIYFRNNLNSNLNLIYNTSSFRVYPIQLVKRYNLLNSLVESSVMVGNEKAGIDDLGIKILSLSSVKYLLSPYEIATPSSLLKVFETKENLEGFPSYKIYENSQALPRAYFVESTVVAKTLEDFVRYLADEKFDIKKTAIVESVILGTPPWRGTPESQTDSGQARMTKNERTQKTTIQWLKDSPQEIILKVDIPTTSLLVLADSYYPGWKAFIDGKETAIQPVNLNFRGIMVEQGSHEIKFTYQPKSFFWGKIISIGSLVFLLFLTIRPLFRIIF